MGAVPARTAPGRCSLVYGTRPAPRAPKLAAAGCLETLQEHNNRPRAAAELGISRVALCKKLHKYGLMTPRYPKGDDPLQR